MFGSSASLETPSIESIVLKFVAVKSREDLFSKLIIILSSLADDDAV